MKCFFSSMAAVRVGCRLFFNAYHYLIEIPPSGIVKIKNVNCFIIQGSMRSMQIKCLENNRIYGIIIIKKNYHEDIIFATNY